MGIKESRPLISVIITAYNHGRFLAQAIDSVLAQTFQNCELIIVDDGSTDNSAAVVARYPCARCIHQTNQGLPAARNAGLLESQGQYVVFLDADDRLLPNALEAAIKCFAADPTLAFISGLYRCIDSEGAPLSGPLPEPVAGNRYLALLRRNYISMHAAVTYRRDILVAVGGFDTRLRACEDWDIYLRIALRYPVGSHRALVAEYRQHEKNMSRDVLLMITQAVKTLKLQERHIGNDPARRKAYGEGLSVSREHYTSQMFGSLPGLLSQPKGFWSVLALVGSFTLRSPGTVLKLGATKLRTRLRSRARAFCIKTLRTLIPNLTDPDPAVGRVSFGDLRRLEPISRQFGYDRGLPIDRHYIEAFLGRHAQHICDRTLEIGGNEYTVRFGGNRVRKSEILHVNEGNPKATYVADLARGASLPSDAFDCIICTQTLHLIYETKEAIATLHRILKPNGILLITVPGTISQLEDGVWQRVWHWGFTGLSMRKLCEHHFSNGHLEINVHGNVLASVAFLQGLSAGDLHPEELAVTDPLYPLLITVRAQKKPASTELAQMRNAANPFAAIT